MKTYYVGMDVHKATIVIAVLDVNGKVVSQSIIKTSTQTVRDFLQTLRGELHVTFEEGNHTPSLWRRHRTNRWTGARIASFSI